MEIIKSVASTDTEILQSILHLYVPSKIFDLDPTYSKGNFYKEIIKPIHKYDINPQLPEVSHADCATLPFSNETLNSIVFDPPFLFRNRPSTNNDINCKRFSYFKSWEEMLDMYKKSLDEFYRILAKDGILCFKCQDMTDNKFYPTHVMVYDLARYFFEAVDLFILIKDKRIYHSECNQIHARKFHSYWWVFRKPRR